jgi:YVTN family beta-propeller protein
VSPGPSESAGAPPKVFISYRREETAAYAGRLYDAMAPRFGDRNVFMDVDLEPGIDFVEKITEAVGACHVLIVVMGPRWATVENEDGVVRLADSGDFVRLEVGTALRRADVTVIPVLVGGARMPDAEDLPQEISPITRRNALDLSDTRWRYDVGRLVKTLEELLAELTATQPAAATQPPARPARELERPGRRRLAFAIGGLAVLVAAAVAAILALSGGGSGGPEPIASIDVGSAPVALTVGSSVWVASQGGPQIDAIDPANDRLARSPIHIDGVPFSIAVGLGSIWVANHAASTVMRLDPSERPEPLSIPVGDHPSDVAVDDRWVWVTDDHGVSRVDPETNRVDATVQLTPPGSPSPPTSPVATGEGAVWAATAGSMWKIDPEQAKTVGDPIPIGDRPNDIVVGEGSVWEIDIFEGLTRIDPDKARVAEKIAVGSHPHGVKTGFGYVWVANGGDSTVSRVDPETDQVDATIPINADPADIAVGKGAVWTANNGASTVTKIQP